MTFERFSTLTGTLLSGNRRGITTAVSTAAGTNRSALPSKGSVSIRPKSAMKERRRANARHLPAALEDAVLGSSGIAPSSSRAMLLVRISRSRLPE